MRRILVLTVLSLLSTLGNAQSILTYQKPDPSKPPFGVMLKRSVVNVELKCKDGASTISAAGTGFIVAYGDPRIPKGSYFDYLVTNRHVAECWDDQRRPKEITSLMIRVNLKDGSSKRLQADPKAWHLPSDESVDLAVMPVNLPDDALFTVIPTDRFGTKDIVSGNQIAEGSPILLSGYFYQFSGERRFQSIVRQGILSMMPDEPMTTTTGKPGTIYLGDVHIFGGNSGSPVMVAADWLNIGGYYLLGVVSGYYYEDEDFNLEIATTVKGVGHANSGIAMIVPVDFLKELLDLPELKAIREANIIQPASATKP